MNTILTLSLALLALIAPLALASSSCACCPDGFDNVEGRCIQLGKEVGQHQYWNWTDARKLCASFTEYSDTWDSDLPSVDSDFLSIFSSYVVKEYPGMKKYNYWVGVQTVDGHWQSLDGSPISIMSYVWHSSEPTTEETGYSGYVLAGTERYYRFLLHARAASSFVNSFVCEAKQRPS